MNPLLYRLKGDGQFESGKSEKRKEREIWKIYKNLLQDQH